MRYYSKIKRKLLWLAVLVVLSVFLLGFTTDIFAVELGNPLTTYENFTYEADGIFTMEFTAKTSFNVVWEEYDGTCRQKPTPIGAFHKFYAVATDFLGTYKGAYFVNKDNLGVFNQYNTCDITENYTAGDTYTAYLVDFNNRFSKTDSVETIKANSLRDKDIETDIDEDSVFILAEGYDGTQYLTYHELNFMPEMNIVYPLDESKVISNFEMKVDFDNAGSYDRIMVVFEDWNASSTCPAETDFSYWVERNAYFNNRSMPFFSDRLSTSTGSTTFEIYGLGLGNYNCNKCYFVNDTTGAMSENLCKGYDLSVEIYVLAPPETPEHYLPFASWPDYYTENSERYTTSTPLFDNLAWTFEPLINNIGKVILFFNGFFDTETANEKGAEFGNIIPIFRGYLEQFNYFFGGVPVSEFLLFYLITAIVVIIYRLVKGLLTIIIP